MQIHTWFFICYYGVECRLLVKKISCFTFFFIFFIYNFNLPSFYFLIIFKACLDSPQKLTTKRPSNSKNCIKNLAFGRHLITCCVGTVAPLKKKLKHLYKFWIFFTVNYFFEIFKFLIFFNIFHRSHIFDYLNILDCFNTFDIFLFIFLGYIYILDYIIFFNVFIF